MLHGRTQECAAVVGIIDDARQSRGGALVIAGEPGVGKTALLDHAVAGATDLRLLRGVGAPSEAGLPFAALHQLLRTVLGGIDVLPHPQAEALRAAFGLATGGEPERFLIALATLTLLSNVAEDGPLLCVVDDAQWVDAESLDVLAFVARRIDTEPVALLAATNDIRHVPAGLATLTVTGLDRVANDALLVERTTVEPAPHVRALLWEMTRGNPLALLETTAALRDEQLSGREPIDRDLIPGAALQQALLARVAPLPDATRTLLLVVAVEGTGDLALVLQAGAKLGVDAEALQPAEAADIVTVDDRGVTFRHPLLRTAVYQDAPFGRRQVVHRTLADLLTRDADADRRVWHLSAATVAPDDGVADALVDAAARARSRGGHAAAATAYARASDLTSDVTRAGARMVQAADAAWAAGRSTDTRAYLDRAAALGAPRAEAEHLRGLVEANTGDRRVALATMLTAATLAEDDPSLAARILVDAGHVAWSDADATGMVEVAQRLTDLHIPPTAPEVFPANVMIGLGRVAFGDMVEGVERIHAALSPADPTSPRQLHLAGTAAIFAGDERAAFELLQRSLARARELGMASQLPHTLTNLASIELWRGNLPSARAYATESAEVANAVDQQHWIAHSDALLAWMAALQGNEAECERLAGDADEIATPRHVRSPAALARWARALAAMGTSRWSDALALLEAVADEHAVNFHPTIAFLSTGDLVETAIRVNRVDLAHAALAKFEAFAGRTGATWASAVAARSRALLLDGDQATAAFEDALAQHSRSERRIEEARTRLLYGEFLRRDRQRSEARVHLRKALDTFERVGATPWEARATAELRATGETSRKRQFDTFAELTPQQIQIVRLVREGATNKEVAAQLFLSPRTVDYHLRNVFVKLGIKSRAELMRLGD